MDQYNHADERVDVLSDLLARVLARQEDERRTVIHALQENVGQNLAALALNLRVLEHRSDQTQVAELISNMRRLTTSALQEIDMLQQQLYPAALGSQGLVSAIEVYIQTFAHASQIQVELDAEVPPQRLPPNVEIALFRVVQDVLEHLRDQQSVSLIDVRLRLVKDYVYLVIENDGTVAVRSWHTDLMAERVQSLGGQSAMMALPFTGARFEIALPLHKKAEV